MRRYSEQFSGDQLAALAATVASYLPCSVPVGEPFQRLFGPCRSTQMELIARREIESYLVGEMRGRRHIITRSYLAYIQRQRDKEAAGLIGMASPNPRARQHQAIAASTVDERGTIRRHSATIAAPHSGGSKTRQRPTST